jgi:hypothetical protein
MLMKSISMSLVGPHSSVCIVIAFVTIIIPHRLSLLYTHINKRTYTCIYTYIHTYIRTYTCIYTYIHTYVHTYIHTYVHIHIHTYIQPYIHTYVHIYIHTRIHTQRIIPSGHQLSLGCGLTFPRPGLRLYLLQVTVLLESHSRGCDVGTKHGSFHCISTT